MTKKMGLMALGLSMVLLSGCGGGGGDDGDEAVNGKIESKYLGIWHVDEAAPDGSVNITYVYEEGAVTFVGNVDTGACYQADELTVTQFYDRMNNSYDDWEEATNYRDMIVNNCGTYETMAALVPGGGTSTSTGGTTTTTTTTTSTTTSSDLTGSGWSVAETGLTENCGDGLSNVNYSITVISYSGGTITVSTPVGNQSGTYSGSNISYSGSYPEDGGTTTASASLTINSGYDELTGTSSWTWSDGSFTCNGTTSIVATRK